MSEGNGSNPVDLEVARQAFLDMPNKEAAQAWLGAIIETSKRDGWDWDDFDCAMCFFRDALARELGPKKRLSRT